MGLMIHVLSVVDVSIDGYFELLKLTYWWMCWVALIGLLMEVLRGLGWLI